MIEKTTAYKTASGVFPTIEDAQKAELKLLWGATTTKEGQSERDAALDWIMDKKDAILDILTMTASSKPQARKINGGKKTRKTPADRPAAPHPMADGNFAGISR